MSLGAFLLISSCAEKTVEIPAKTLPVLTLKKQAIPYWGEFPAQVYGIQDVPIRARVVGFLERIHFREGSAVAKGQLLYSIDPMPYQAKLNAANSELAQARVAGVKAKNDLDRIKPLADDNAVSKRDLDAAIASFDASRASIKAAEANVNLAQIEFGYAAIATPINGVIGKTLATTGEFVGSSPNPVILNTVSRIDSIKVEFFIPEQQYLQLARILIAESPEDHRPMVFTIILSDGSTLEEEGTFSFLDRAVESSTGSIRAQVLFPNKDNLVRPGQFVRLRVTQEREENVIAIPARAIADLQGQKFVYVVQGDSTIKRSIQVRDVLRDLVIVGEGLEEGERIVLEGIQTLKTGSRIKAEEVKFESVNDIRL